MPKFPVDAPNRRVVRPLATLGFQIVNEREHIALTAAESRRPEHAIHPAKPAPSEVDHAPHHLHSVGSFAS